MLCEDCRHWRKWDSEFGDYGECRHQANISNPASPPNLDGASDMELGRIFTGPKFGCVHSDP